MHTRTLESGSTNRNLTIRWGRDEDREWEVRPSVRDSLGPKAATWSRAVRWVIVLSKAISFLIVYTFHFPASGVLSLSPLCAFCDLFWKWESYDIKQTILLSVQTRQKVISLLCLSAPPSFSNMKCSRYDFCPDSELGGCQCCLAPINQMPLRKLSGVFCAKHGQIRTLGTAGEDAEDALVYIWMYVCMGRSMFVFLVFICL